MIIAIYRHIPQDGYIDSLRIEEKNTKGLLFLRNQFVPGALGFPGMYVKKYQFDGGLLITYTCQILSIEEIVKLDQRVKVLLDLSS